MPYSHALELDAVNEQADLRIRAMAPEEIAVAADWAAAVGWNPGLGDAACFATVDAGGFFIGELVGDADHRAFGDVVVAAQDLLDLAGRQAMAGDVDHVVDARHHEDVAVVVDIARVAGLVVAGILREVGLPKTLVGVP